MFEKKVFEKKEEPKKVFQPKTDMRPATAKPVAKPLAKPLPPKDDKPLTFAEKMALAR